MFKPLRNQRGFTLVELLVVVIILAVLAAMVIPQLRSSSTDAKISALDTDLSAMRSSIELYYHQHNNAYPGAIKQHEGAGNHADNAQAFLYQLTYCSDVNGNTDTTCDNTFKYGPYLKKGIPKNPLPNAVADTDAEASAVTIDTATASLGNEDKANDGTATGWYYYQLTGEFYANNTAYDTR